MLAEERVADVVPLVVKGTGCLWAHFAFFGSCIPTPPLMASEFF
jgi:hypothetical protein